jgi:riboflavin synthase
MFTGLIKEIGKIKEVRHNREGREFIIESKELISQMAIDDSVCVNGACQTVTEVGKGCFKVQTVHITLQKTTLGDLKTGSRVNLELALRPIDRFGGHFVQGHVNDVGVITEIKSVGKNCLLTVKYPKSLANYLTSEGPITLDGVGLTIAKLDKRVNSFTVSVIPHTLENTVLADKRRGDRLNLEVDLLAKYVENFFHQGHQKMTKDWLLEKGF